MKTILITKILFLIFSNMMLLGCCSKIFVDEELTLKKSNYIGDELKTNGFYYRHVYSKNNAEYYDTYILYRNGVVRYGGTINNLNNLNNDILDGTKKDHWGIFKIINNNILIETWQPANTMQGYPVYIKEGMILNKESFELKYIYKSNSLDKKLIGEIYLFRELSIKPDSTNNFIK